jgi:hypothetical protein
MAGVPDLIIDQFGRIMGIPHVVVRGLTESRRQPVDDRTKLDHMGGRGT